MKITPSLLTTVLGLSLALAPAVFNTTALADQIWVQRYDGPGHGDDFPYAVVTDGAGNAIVTGISRNQNGNDDFYTAKYAAGDGGLLWEHPYDGPVGRDDRGTGVAIDIQGNVVVTGYSANGNDPNGNIPFDFYTAKYAAANGLLLWERRGPYSPGPALATEARSIKRVAVDGDGNVVVTGVSFTNGWRGFYTAKYAAANGQPIWEKFYAGPGLGGPGGDWPLALAVDDAGNVIVTGASDCGCSNPDREEIYTVKYAATDGRPVWDRRYDSGTGGDDRPVGVAVDRNGNVLLSGVTINSCCVIVQPAYYTAKYAAASGQILWEQLNFVGVDGAVSRDFIVPQSIVVDSAGNAIVNERNAVANVTPGGSVKNLVKYAGVDGNVIWQQLFEVGNCIGAAPSALAVDIADNVIVTGDAGSGDHQILTAKYDATDGHLLWQQTAGSRFSGNFPAPFQSTTSGLAVDGAGNIVVSGESRTANGNLDFVTFKFAPSGNSSTTINCPANIVTGTDSGYCSAVVNFSATATDVCGNAVAVTCSPPSGSSFPKGTTTVTCTTGDGSQCTFTVTVTNAAPVVTITGPPSGAVYPVGAPVNFTGTFTDNAGDTHTAQWLFDGFPVAATVNEANGQVSATCTFSSAGVYMVKLIVTDSCGNAVTASTVSGLPAMVVIYDPNGGFVTGGGWINSPAGAYVAQPTLTGKASFGFVSNYQKGATVPTGETEFQFQVANFNFHSSSYEWLVISGARAQYKGLGTVNGAGNYGFILAAIDGQINGGGGVDKFRIKIWDKSNNDAIVYDNQLGASDSGDPTTVIGGGSIVIHK